jgi:hypothetical protein
MNLPPGLSIRIVEGKSKTYLNLSGVPAEAGVYL